MNKSTKNLLIILVFFGIYYVLDEMYFKILRKWIFESIDHFGSSHIITYIISGIPLFVGTLLIDSKRGFLENLGLNKSILKGFLFALVCTSPMFIGFSIVFELNLDISFNTILVSVIAAAVFEELYFRGFLFGLPFRNTKLGFITSVFFGALYFGVLHLYQSNEPSELLGIFLITFLGGVLFAWVYTEWTFNIWVPIFLHMLMNLSWELFAVSDNALGNSYANVFRLITVILVIVLTVIYKKRNGLKFKINKNNIWTTKGIA